MQSWSSLCRILLSQTFSGNSRIVFAVVNDPVEQGFILSMAHPAGNVTGFSFIDFPPFGRSPQLLKQMAPPRDPLIPIARQS